MWVTPFHRLINQYGLGHRLALYNWTSHWRPIAAQTQGLMDFQTRGKFTVLKYHDCILLNVRRLTNSGWKHSWWLPWYGQCEIARWRRGCCFRSYCCARLSVGSEDRWTVYVTEKSTTNGPQCPLEYFNTLYHNLICDDIERKNIPHKPNRERVRSQVHVLWSSHPNEQNEQDLVRLENH